MEQDVNIPVLRSLLVPLPPLPEQQRIAETLSAVDAKMQVEERHKAAQQRLLKTALDHLMTGKVCVIGVIDRGARRRRAPNNFCARGVRQWARRKGHISHVMLEAIVWERSVAYQLERIPELIAYVRNDHRHFSIPYAWQWVRHEYRPDFVIRYRKETGEAIKIILEIKGFRKGARSPKRRRVK